MRLVLYWLLKAGGWLSNPWIEHHVLVVEDVWVRDDEYCEHHKWLLDIDGEVFISANDHCE